MKKLFIVIFLISSLTRSLQAQTSLNQYIKRMDERGDKTMLLVGSGSHYERGKNPDIFTFDITLFARPSMVGDITKRSDTTKIPSNSFDIVELEHLPTDIFHEGASQTFTEILRILRPGGYLKFNDMTEWTTGMARGPFMCQITTKDHESLRRMDSYSSSEIQRKLTDLADETTALFFFKLGYSWIKHVEDGHWYLFKK